MENRLPRCTVHTLYIVVRIILSIAVDMCVCVCVYMCMYLSSFFIFEVFKIK